MPPGTWTRENWTWDNFLETAKALTIEDERWGALLYKDTSCETIYTVNNGEPTGIYSEDGTQFTLANPNAVAGMQWVADLTCVHGVQPPWGDLSQDNAQNQHFVSGKVSMLSSTYGFAAYANQNATTSPGRSPRPGRSRRPNHHRHPDRLLHSQGRRERRRSLTC